MQGIAMHDIRRRRAVPRRLPEMYAAALAGQLGHEPRAGRAATRCLTPGRSPEGGGPGPGAEVCAGLRAPPCRIGPPGSPRGQGIWAVKALTLVAFMEKAVP